MPRGTGGVRTIITLQRPVPSSTLRKFPDTTWVRYCGSTFDLTPNPDLARDEQEHLLSLLEVLRSRENCRFLAVHNATLPEDFLIDAMRIDGLELIVVIDCVEVDDQRKYADVPDARIQLLDDEE